MAFQTTYLDVQPLGYSGQLAGGFHVISTFKNAEASASMPFGVAVKFKTSSPVTDLDVLFPTAITDLVAGIVAKSTAYERSWADEAGVVHGQLDAVGLIAGQLISLVRKGRVLVTCVSGCKPGDRLFVRALTGSFTVIGGCENAADASNMIDCTKQGQWMSTAVAGGLAWLEVDFVNKP